MSESPLASPHIANEQRSISPEHYHYEALLPITTERFANTPFVREAEFTPEDVKTVRMYLVEAAQYAHPNLFPNFWETTLLASIYARKITEQIRPEGLETEEAEALNLIHDLGRLISPGQYYRNDLLAGSLERRAGFRTETVDKLPDLGRILGIRGEPIESIDDLTPAQRILHVSDWLGKRNQAGSLVTPGEIIEASNRSMETYRKSAVWPSTSAGMNAIIHGKNELGTEIFQAEVAWCEHEGIDWTRMREEVETEVNLPENQAWIMAAKEAHETLDRKIDEQLHRPDIQHIVFDVGGVLFTDSQADFIQGIADRFGQDPEAVATALNRLAAPEYMSGLVPAEEYLPSFFRSIALGNLGLSDMEKAFSQPSIYRPPAGMSALVQDLEGTEKVQLSVLSDSIQAVAEPLRQEITRYFPALDPVLISGELGASKAEDSGSVFGLLLNRLGDPDPASVLFIDDKEAYTLRARLTGMRSLTFRSNPYTQIDPIDRLRHELEKSGIL